MAITMKSLIALFFFTVFLIISSVHCRMTTTTSPGYGIKQQDRQCFEHAPYLCRGGEGDCRMYCRDLDFSYGTCFSGVCCCQI
ncbi:unnamed protein product [Arabidopsis lyrata]|uniref:Predicted protein n=1 Tax=Arabidopsis lyrata subsp. lyrata TaxID=81972 RepID=D7MY95_ARALL|nr:defensin-like protein 107 [Arabidopsis lyrata subsp. lyrata]EFH38486.1 predicted protein [Arabidopsis lyrata subsp. lyrata]CAH8265509.1 unnamed protein product [Arabidopsis lyrata]|eukprot:XP_002862228.1 defensin-like protein 107 [Arabidopsis lyrata subsp. lyrata]